MDIGTIGVGAIIGSVIVVGTNLFIVQQNRKRDEIKERLEKLNVEAILREKNINERVIFYGDEEIVSNNILWRIFAIIKSLSPNFVSFYNFPHEKLIGVARRAEI